MAIATVRPLTGMLLVLKVWPLGSGEGPIGVHIELLIAAEFRLKAPTLVDPATVLALVWEIPACRFIWPIARPRAPGSPRRSRRTPRSLFVWSARRSR